MVAPGEKPDLSFRLKVWRDGRVEELAFRDLLRRRTIVSVYMKNNTPSCDRQTENLAQHAEELSRAGYDLIALSRNTCTAHARYAAAKGIGYTLASDPDDRFAHAVDAIVQKSMYGRRFEGPARAAFVFDRDGTVLGVIPKVESARHGEQLLSLIKGL